jgi:hypothetical protein
MDSDVEFYYDDALRWTFGFDNPNKAAVIFACLFPLCWLLWSLAWKIKLSGLKWPSIVLASGPILADAFCLFKTYSRGGVVAALLGGFYLLWRLSDFDSGCIKRLHSKKFYCGSGLGILTILLFIWLGLGNRSVEPVTSGDASVSHRFVVWQSALEMAVDNPAGFGTGHSGEAYMQWYEPPDMKAAYRTMVNSYLTFLVEQGWVLSAFALMVFVGLWFLTEFPNDQSIACEVAAGLRASILAFSFSGLFSTVMEEPLLWIIPGICAGALISLAFLRRVRPARKKVLAVILYTLVILAALYGGGLVQRSYDPSTRKCGALNGQRSVVEFGPKSSNSLRTWIVMPDPKILGDSEGKLLRQLALQADVQLKIQSPTSDIPPDARLLLVGDSIQATPMSCVLPVVLLFPSIITNDQADKWLKSCPQSTVMVPGIDEDGRASFWQNYADRAKLDQSRINKLDGVGLRIDWAWPDVIALVKKEN